MLHGPAVALFLGTSIVLLLTPGPAVLYIVTRSIDQGRFAGLISVMGICTGTLVHVVAAALGLSALLGSSAAAFSAVKYAGAFYLIGLGVQMVMRRDAPPGDSRREDAGLRRVFAQGVIVNVLNPHTALFFFAFLPQFVNSSAGHVSVQMLALGVMFVALSATTDSGWALAAGTAGAWIKRHPHITRRQRYVTGGALIGLGAAMALTGGRHE